MFKLRVVALPAFACNNFAAQREYRVSMPLLPRSSPMLRDRIEARACLIPAIASILCNRPSRPLCERNGEPPRRHWAGAGEPICLLPTHICCHSSSGIRRSTRIQVRGLHQLLLPGQAEVVQRGSLFAQLRLHFPATALRRERHECDSFCNLLIRSLATDAASKSIVALGIGKLAKVTVTLRLVVTQIVFPG